MKQLCITCLMLISIPSFSQININYFYRPARIELETDLFYNYKDWTVGFRHNQWNNYFRPSNKSITCGYVQIPIINHLKWEFVYGIGYIHDYESSLIFQFPRINLEIGYSKINKLLIELNYNLYETRSNSRRLPTFRK